MTTNRKAEFFGTCQCCGRTQKLPKGVLSLHGYTVAQGWFSGVCRGAKHLPFEQSCDEVKRYIAEAEQQIEALKLEAVNVLAEVKFARVTYLGSDWTGRTMRKSIVTEIRVAEKGSRVFNSFEAVLEESPSLDRRSITTISRKINSASTVEQMYATDTEAACASMVRIMNESFVNEVIARQIVQLTNYIAWQQRRIQNLTPSELKSIKPKKDENAFEVAE